MQKIWMLLAVILTGFSAGAQVQRKIAPATDTTIHAIPEQTMGTANRKKPLKELGFRQRKNSA